MRPVFVLDDRPGLWPFLGMERGLPHDIEQCLALSDACVFSDQARSLELADRAIGLARADAQPSVLARTLYSGAVLTHGVGQPLRAYLLCRECESLLERLDDRWRATLVLLLRGQCWLSVDERERALTLISEAIERFAKMGDDRALAICQQSLALTHRLGADLVSAVECAARASAILPSDERGSLHQRLCEQEARLRLELGQRRAQEASTELARMEFARAWTVLPDLASIDPAQWTSYGAQLLVTIGRVAWAHGDTALARRAVLRIAQWARCWRSAFERGLAWQALGEWRRHQGRQAAATANIRRAVAFLERMPMEPCLLEAQRTLADMVENGGDLCGAYVACCKTAAIEAEQQRHTVALRAELLLLDVEAEQESRKSEPTLAYAQRLSNVGHLVASVNHELNQPMASIRLLGETALALIDQGDLAEVTGSIREMHRISERLADVAGKLAAFPAEAPKWLGSVGLRFAVDEALSTLRSRLAQTPCELERQLPDVRVWAHEGQLIRVISNVVNNAVDVLSAQNVRRIEFNCHVSADHVTLSVSDNGPGLSAAVRARLFEPFFSTKQAGQGLGLGLALSRQVMHEMGGDLTARMTGGRGAVFEIKLAALAR